MDEMDDSRKLKISGSLNFGFFVVEEMPDYGWVVRCSPAVVIVPLLMQENTNVNLIGCRKRKSPRVGLLEILRSPIQMVSWEFPGGAIERGETIEEASKRELFEETGTYSDIHEPIGRFYEAPGRMSFMHEVIIAWNPRFLNEHYSEPGAHEGIRDFQFFSLHEVEKKIRSSGICAGPTLAALAIFRTWLKTRQT